MKTMRIRAKALFEEISYLPIMCLSGRIAAQNLIEKELIEVFNSATDSPNIEIKGGTFNDTKPVSTNPWVDDKDSRLANLDLSEFSSQTDPIVYY